MITTKQISSTPATRNYGIDALRILSMFMVLVLHVLGAGGVLAAAKPFSASYITAWTLETLAYCAVNCYGLISGYVGIHSKFKYTNLALLWLQVLIYSVVGTLIFYLIDPDSVGGLRLLYSFFPVSKNYFWYFSSYFGLYLFIPLLNRVINGLNVRQAKFLCLSIVLVFSVLPTVMNFDPFATKGGYTVFWLMLLYILGACIRKFDLLAKVKTVTLAVGYLLAVAASVGLKLFLNADIFPILANFLSEDSLISYTAPTILFCGISLLIIFSRFNHLPNWSVRGISFFAPVAFGVYIIHSVEHINALLFKDDRFGLLADYHPVLMVLAVLLSACAIFIVCALIDGLRLLLFKKLRIKQRLLKLEDKYIGDLWNSQNTPK